MVHLRPEPEPPGRSAISFQLKSGRLPRKPAGNARARHWNQGEPYVALRPQADLQREPDRHGARRRARHGSVAASNAQHGPQGADWLGAGGRRSSRGQVSTMKKRILALSIGAIVVGAGAFTVVSRPSAAQKVRAPVASMTVSLVSAQSAEFVRAIAATGTINARDELVIGSDAVRVPLTEVLVEGGAKVKKGQLLARADDAQLRAQLAQQQAAVKQAQAE